VLCGRQFRRRGNQALSDHGHDKSRSRQRCAEISDPTRACRSFPGWLARGREESLFGGEKILRGDQGLVAEQAAEGFDFFLGPMGEVGQGALAGLWPSRQPSRRRMAGGELRLGTMAMYMR